MRASSSARLPVPLHDRADGLNDVLIAGAAAEIAGQPLADLLVGGERIFPQQIDTGHQHAGRAEAALQGMELAERLLERRQLLARAQALDGLDGGAVRLHREGQTGAGAVAVDQDRAGATDAVLAARMRPGEAEFLAQEVVQQETGLDSAAVGPAVYPHPHVVRGAHWGPPLLPFP